jgi:tRNA (guanine37-N1)-methyltransferase
VTTRRRATGAGRRKADGPKPPVARATRKRGKGSGQKRAGRAISRRAAALRIDILTLFPAIFDSVFAQSLLGKAIDRGLIEVRIHDIREHAEGRHRVVDDAPYGGGDGMVMKPGPVVRAIEAVRGERGWVILTTPAGALLTQARARALSAREHLVIVCGRYGGVDERVSRIAVDEEISIGDYVLGGGEPAAIVLVDAIARLVPGVVGNAESTVEDSFEAGLLEYPQYTRPASFRGLDVPAVLLAGHHGEVDRWRREQALRRTRERRPELLGPEEMDAPRASKTKETP